MRRVTSRSAETLHRRGRTRIRTTDRLRAAAKRPTATPAPHRTERRVPATTPNLRAAPNRSRPSTPPTPPRRTTRHPTTGRRPPRRRRQTPRPHPSRTRTRTLRAGAARTPDTATDVDHPTALVVAHRRKDPPSPPQGARHHPGRGRHRPPGQRRHPAARDEQPARPHRGDLGRPPPHPRHVTKTSPIPVLAGALAIIASARPRRRAGTAWTPRLADAALRQLNPYVHR